MSPRKHERNFDEEVIHREHAPLASIKVGIYNEAGDIFEIATLEELARTGDWQRLYMNNYGHCGEVVCELVAPANEFLMRKLGYLRSRLAEAQ
jgi:hypothetical protein